MSSKCSIWARYFFFLNSLLLLEEPTMHAKCVELCFVDKRCVCWFSHPTQPRLPGRARFCMWFALQP